MKWNKNRLLWWHTGIGNINLALTGPRMFSSYWLPFSWLFNSCVGTRQPRVLSTVGTLFLVLQGKISGQWIFTEAYFGPGSGQAFCWHERREEERHDMLALLSSQPGTVLL